MAESMLFSTTEAVIEVLWDIVLAFYIIKISFIYFILIFFTGALLSFWTTTRLAPINHLIAPQSELVVLPLQLLATALWARFIIKYYEIPRSLQFRLAIGILSTVFMIIAELLGAVVLYVEGSEGWLWERDYRAAILFAGLLVAFCFMPAWMMALEIRYPKLKETNHGHENKSLFNAVPTVILGKEREADTKKKE
ncbi:hypothetical protein GQ53DRAFT_743494 [Thozetella sp. PMI_491]|nr:hypothetical protein GQ53DRAFT_743494 [Thozetella sp. PMI_491]